MGEEKEVLLLSLRIRLVVFWKTRKREEVFSAESHPLLTCEPLCNLIQLLSSLAPDFTDIIRLFIQWVNPKAGN